MSGELQSKRQGVVVYCTINPETEKGFGFIEPAGSNGDRENNIWFGFNSVRRYALDIERGDIVDYVLVEKDLRGTSAKCVWLKRKVPRNVETIPGEYDVDPWVAA